MQSFKLDKSSVPTLKEMKDDAKDLFYLIIFLIGFVALLFVSLLVVFGVINLFSAIGSASGAIIILLFIVIFNQNRLR